MEDRQAPHGRQSLLKDVAKDMSEYEGYLSVLKSVLSRSTNEEEFDEFFMEELDPTMTEKRAKIMALSENPDSFRKLRRNPWNSIQRSGWVFY